MDSCDAKVSASKKTLALEQGRADVAGALAALDPNRLVHRRDLIKTNMVPLRG